MPPRWRGMGAGRCEAEAQRGARLRHPRAGRGRPGGLEVLQRMLPTPPAQREHGHMLAVRRDAHELEGCGTRCALAPGEAEPLGCPEEDHRKGDPVSPIFAIPFLNTKCFKIGWLHVADQGVSANCLGSLFVLLLEKMPGASKEDRVASLFAGIQELYKTTGCQSRLDGLTHAMIRKNAGSTPKLRGKGADIRALVPYGFEAAQRLLDSAHPLEGTAKRMAAHLNDCYKMLPRAMYQHSALAEQRRNFCVLALAMESQDPVTWGTKPKLHLFQELCEMSDYCPSLCWCYRDEDMGGSLAKIAHRKGGALSAKATAQGVLGKWCARYPVPQIGSNE